MRYASAPISKTILLSALLLVAPTSAMAWNACDEVHVVVPQKSYAGTIYVRETGNQSAKLVSRAGYLPVGTLLSTKNSASGTRVEVSYPKVDDGRLVKFISFTSIRGDSGLVERDAIRSLHELLAIEAGGRPIHGTPRCEDFKGIVVPTHHKERLSVFRDVASNGPVAFTMSRSAFKLVVVTAFPPTERTSIAGEILYEVSYLDQEEKPRRALWKKGYIRKFDEDVPATHSKLFRISEVPPERVFSYPPIEIDECQGSIDCLKSFLRSIASLLHDDSTIDSTARKLFDKNCDAEDTISFTLKAGSSLPIPILEIQSGIEGKRTYKLPVGEKYISRQFKSVTNTGIRDGHVVVTAQCSGSMTVAASRISIALPALSVMIRSADIEKRLNKCLVGSSRMDANSRHWEKMFIVPYDLGSHVDIFASFWIVEKFIQSQIGTQHSLSSWQRGRVASFIFSLLSGWHDQSDAAPELDSSCITQPTPTDG